MNEAVQAVREMLIYIDDGRVALSGLVTGRQQQAGLEPAPFQLRTRRVALIVDQSPSVRPLIGGALGLPVGQTTRTLERVVGDIYIREHRRRGARVEHCRGVLRFHESAV